MPSGVYIRTRRSSTQTPEDRYRTERKYRLKDKFGMSLEEYDRMLEEQNNKCFICLKEETSTYKGMIRALAVDHDHTTGQIRRLLCGNCNMALGKIKENFDTAINLAKYIQEYKGVV